MCRRAGDAADQNYRRKSSSLSVLRWAGRAYAALGQHRSTQRKVPRGREDEERLTADIIELAQQYGRNGYRKVAGLLRQAGWIINRSGRRVGGTGGQIQMLRQIM